MLKVVVFHHAKEIADYQRERLSKIDEEAQTIDLSTHLLKFTADRRAWLNARKSMHDYEKLQHKIRKTVPFKRSSAARLVILPGVTVADLCNELIDFPAWIGYHFYFMRVCNKSGVNIVYDDINYAVKENNKLRHLRVKLSRYSYTPQAVTASDSKKVFSGGRVTLDHFPLSSRPPSIASESGVSTITKMSTATTSPNSWRNDWTMQATHDDYDHRLTETTIANPRETRAVGAEQFAIRLNNEINSRLSLVVADMDTVATTLNLNNRMDPRVVCVCEFESPRVMLETIGDLKWLHNAEKRIAEIIATPSPTADDKKDLQVKLRNAYNIPTKIFQAQEGTIFPGRASKNHLFINESWRRTIDANRLPANVINVLKLLVTIGSNSHFLEGFRLLFVTDRHSWLLDSDYSNITLVSRCDKLCKTRITDFFHRFYLSDRQTNLLAIGTLALFLFLFIFFCIIFILKPNSLEDADIGYCPASAFGFDTDDPQQVSTMRETYDIRTATYSMDPAMTTNHFFMSSDNAVGYL
ncbi:unnamed protein product [Toxocara canis]|uniref:Uncharacterized protein n=1 Tax=Toxocara canis TaxID=6265 RepID=A0A183UGR1_TOXCA|nr:unnamed protein product [Toxocara canis]